MAIIIMLDLNVAQKFGGNMELWDRLESRSDHATAGMIVTFLFILSPSLSKNSIWSFFKKQNSPSSKYETLFVIDLSAYESDPR